MSRLYPTSLCTLRNSLNYRHRLENENNVFPSLACANNRLIFSRPCIDIISRQTVALPQRDRYSQCYDTLARIRGQQLFRDTRSSEMLAPSSLFLSPFLILCHVDQHIPLWGESFSSCDLHHEWALFKRSHEQSYRCACSPDEREAVRRCREQRCSAYLYSNIFPLILSFTFILYLRS